MASSSLHTTLIAAAASIAIGGVANAAEVLVKNDIKTSTTWTANNVYNLQKQIYVLPGATLTIQAGTLIASTTNIGGSLAVTRGAQIIVQGTADKPVIMTSKADVATWTNNDPHTGKWRVAANEWGNLTLMGRAYISSNAISSNTPTPNPNNVTPMEGLIASGPNDPNVLFGGGNDDDDSGSISYLSIRYGGKVVSLNKELNGLSLGGIGRATDIHHVEIMNNVDDGIEIWGGTVGLKYLSIWNVGDDSLDIDEGFRGKVQFALLVQGYSLDADQGSGVGDNALETDGAEDSHYQPVSTTTLYNLTVIGQPQSGDGLTAWRDNARIQYRNCIFMDGGEQLVRFDNKDGDGANGYGWQGTLTWPQTWTTSYTQYSKINAPKNPAAFYQTQTSGMLAEITDSVMYNNKDRSAYTEATARGVFAAANNNVQEPSNSPITKIVRAQGKLIFNKFVQEQVMMLDPRPQNDALTAKRWADDDGFFTSATYKGAFASGNLWTNGWTAAEAFGFMPKSPWTDLGYGLGTKQTGTPELMGSGPMTANSMTTITLTKARPSTIGVFIVGAAAFPNPVPVFGGMVVPNFALGGLIVGATNAQGKVSVSFPHFSSIPKGAHLYYQWAILDSNAPQGFTFSNAISGEAQ